MEFDGEVWGKFKGNFPRDPGTVMGLYDPIGERFTRQLHHFIQIF
jgi:hypothetical protein